MFLIHILNLVSSTATLYKNIKLQGNLVVPYEGIILFSKTEMKAMNHYCDHYIASYKGVKQIYVIFLKYEQSLVVV